MLNIAFYSHIADDKYGGGAKLGSHVAYITHSGSALAEIMH